MAGGERTVKIKFIGESKSVAKAAAAAERSVKKLNDNVGKAVGGIGSKIADGISGAIEAIPPMGKLVAGVLVAGLAVAAAPAIGAAISSAVLLGLGGGVLAIGIKRAMNSPAVQAAFDPLKKKFSTILDQFSKPFEGPLVRAAGALNEVLDDLKPAIDRIGRALAPVIDDLAPAFAEFLRQAMPGIEQAVKASVPLFRILADKLPGIGRAIGLFFEKISANGDDTNQFFSDLIDLITNLIIGIGVAIGKLTSWYSNVRTFLTKTVDGFREFRVKVINEFGKVLEGAAMAFSWVPGVGPKLAAANAKFQQFRAKANAELAAIKDRRVLVEAYSNVARVAKDVGRQLRAIKDEKVYISVGSNVGQVVAGINKKIASVAGKRASGGPVRANSSYLVGERGPEVLTLGSGQNGNVTPNRDLAGFSGDLYVQVDLGNAVQQVIKISNRDLKRRAGMQGARA